MIVLIIGGSSGLGQAITRRLAQEVGWTVYFTYNRSKDKADDLLNEFLNTISIYCDFGSKESVAALKQKVDEIAPDVLINNAYAGSFLTTHFHKINPKSFLEEFVLNIVPTVELTQAAISSFRKRKRGKIITILTAALHNVPPAGAAMYVANKAYLQQLSKLWASENAKFNITSNTVSPSFMQTQFTSGIDERVVQQIRESHPNGALLKVEEVAEAVHFLATCSTQINGIDMLINGANSIR
ncbi:SDR family oxidoreductase [Mucilaginibacter terrenus]|uniref:SDR family oxidoreductase n=1 Tax=Mucilaginibacter terrenus TaxID=2482727 RepID=A0A3E2NXP1_9SPHI|nr:SDR family oxidoreductase [Mucilaginibacter terrenus]RFZ85785.1 SDR family oxidoreductase [Mucilaginibacter terrenus]